MEKRTLRSRKGKTRNVRPYDRQNQGIFGRVYSTVKGYLPWLSSWMQKPEDEEAENEDSIAENEDSNDVVSQSVSHANKRLRLRFDDNVPSIQSSGTQTWHEQPTHNLFDAISHVQSSSTQSTLIENKEAIATVLNGDDHSENSEGSASTSGCSSLISSHKESNRIAENPFVSLLDLKNSRKRKESSPKAGFNDLSSRGLWSSSMTPSPKFPRRLLSVSHTNQPSFNLSSFVGPSKLNESVEKKVSSPFYEGKTTFGGASAVRRMPTSVAPYQVDKTLRSQIKVREPQNSPDGLEGMSSAAKRILLTLEKMSTPVADAKKIPNSNTSPVDLSVYVTPPKSRRNSQFTPSVAGKGPPLANINTIAKLATLKNYGVSRLRNTPQSSPLATVDQKSPVDFLQSSSVSETFAQKSGGGKMRNKLNQQHSSKAATNENDINDLPPVLNNVPLPISTLPTINFGLKTEKSSNTHLSKGFTFSSPIEHDLSVPTAPLALPSPYDSFKFSNPIEHELPNSTQPKEKSLPQWECSACWVRNPASRSSCLSCETPRTSKENNSTINSAALKTAQNTSNWECSSCWIKNPSTESKCMACEVPRFAGGKSQDSSFAVSTSAASSTGVKANTWECSSCWVKNPADKSKCMACENPRSSDGKNSGTTLSSASSFQTSVSASTGFKFGSKTLESTTSSNATMLQTSLTASTGFQFGGKTLTSTVSSNSSPLQTSQPANTGFQFGGKTLGSTVVSSASSLQTSQSASTGFQFGGQTLGITKSPASTTTAAASKNTATWECSSCWVRNTMEASKCVACEAPKSSTVNNKGSSSASVSVSSSSATPALSTTPAFSSKNSETWECSSCWVKNPMGELKCIACETPKSSKDNKSEEVKKSENNAFSTWECTSCWVRNPMKEKKCMACETLHPSAETSSAPKDVNSFKFTSPIQNSPITFKFGNYVCTASATTTTSSFKFGLSETPPQTTLSASGFKLPVSSSVNSFFTSAVSAAVSKSSDEPLVSAQSNNSAELKIPPPVTVESKQVEQISNKATSESSETNNKPSISAKTSESKTEPFKMNPDAKVADAIKDIFGKATKSPSELATGTSEDKSSKGKQSDTVITSDSSVSKEKDVPTPSVTAIFGFTTQPVLSTAKAEKKSGQLFTFGDKKDTVNTNLLSKSAASTTVAANTFNFSNNVSSFTSVSDSKASLNPASDAQSKPVKSDEKTSTPASLSTTTASTFVFGGSSVTTPAPSAFSFFPSSTASTAPSFTFGASSSTTQASKPGGFTFKSAEKPQSSSAVTTSTSQSATPGLSVFTPVSASTGGFVFGAPKTEVQTSVSFAFGSGTATPAANASSAFAAFQSSPSTFQFGSQPSGSTAPALGSTSTFVFSKSEAPSTAAATTSQSTVPAFGSTASTFVFGSKNESSVPMPSPASQAAPSLTFGSPASFSFNSKTNNPPATQNPSFGSSAVPAASPFPAPTFVNNPVAAPSFETPDKPAPGGFNFGVNNPSAVFQFGATNPAEKKRPAQDSGFSFGAPASSEASSSTFPSGFTINTPPSFNFGATSTPTAGPFQFAASTAAKSASAQTAPRKYKKALRRVRKD